MQPTYLFLSSVRRPLAVESGRVDNLHTQSLGNSRHWHAASFADGVALAATLFIKIIFSKDIEDCWWR